MSGCYDYEYDYCNDYSYDDECKPRRRHHKKRHESCWDYSYAN
jgi:hypothetical protein